MRRDALETKIIGPLREQQREPVRVAKKAREIEAGYAKQLREAHGRAEAAAVSCASLIRDLHGCGRGCRSAIRI